MWVSGAVFGQAPRLATEQLLAMQIGPIVDRAAPPAMVIDGRMADARPRATSTYRLVAALDLRRAEPVCCWAASGSDAWETIEILLDTLPRNGSALLVAAEPGPPHRWGAAVLSPVAMGAGARPLPRPDLAGHNTPGDGFLQVVAAAATVDNDHEKE